MQFLIVYDISTTTLGGEARLRTVARICEGFGHRVQKSVFEATLDRAGLLQLEHELVTAINPATDSVGIYRLLEPYEQHARHHGQRHGLNHHEPYNL